MSVGGVFKTIAPWLTAALTTGPAGVATMAMQELGAKLGVPAPKTVEQAAALIAKLNGDQLLVVKQIEADFGVKMQQLGFQEVTDLERIAAADRDSARNREIQVRDWTPKVIALAILAFAFACEYMVLRYGYPANVPGEAVGRILATQDALAMAVVYYYFGSSAGSHKKDETIQSAVKDAA